MSNESQVKRPSFYLYVTEVFRAFKDFGKLAKFYISYKKEDLEKGDGHPVLVIPGFLGSDLSTTRIRHFINKLGYKAFGWEMGRNLGKLDKLDLLNARIDVLHQEFQQPVTLIGWSLGGVYARQLAKANPTKVRQIITMGSPINGLTQPNNASWLFRLINRGQKVEDIQNKWLENLTTPAPIPSTAIYSKEDGIVSWRVCMEPNVDAIHQNIQVSGSHVGLGINAAVWYIVSDRLKYKQDNWVLFRKEKEMVDFKIPTA